MSYPLGEHFVAVTTGMGQHGTCRFALQIGSAVGSNASKTFSVENQWNWRLVLRHHVVLVLLAITFGAAGAVTDQQQMAPGSGLQDRVVLSTGADEICNSTAAGDNVEVVRVGNACSSDDVAGGSGPDPRIGAEATEIT